jgi:hypothetical protein
MIDEYIIGTTNFGDVYEISKSEILEGSITLLSVLPTIPTYLHATWVCPSGYLYYVDPGTARIYRSGRQEVYCERPPLNDNRALNAINIDGTPTVITSSQRLGFPSWKTNRRDMLL